MSRENVGGVDVESAEEAREAGQMTVPRSKPAGASTIHSITWPSSPRVYSHATTTCVDIC